MNQKALGLICSVSVLSCLAGAAQAQTTAGALQLGLGTDVVTYNDASATVRYNAPIGDITARGKTTRWGLADRSGVYLEGGYGLGDSMVVGGIIGLGGWSQDGEGTRGNVTTNTGTDSQFDLLLAPKFDYMLLPGQSVRPFFGGAIGLQYHSETTEDPNGPNATEVTKTSATGFALMPRAGVRFFLTPGFSIDPALTFLWIPTASGSREEGNLKYDLTGVHSYTIGLTVAASGWVGL